MFPSGEAEKRGGLWTEEGKSSGSGGGGAEVRSMERSWHVSASYSLCCTSLVQCEPCLGS